MRSPENSFFQRELMDYLKTWNIVSMLKMFSTDSPIIPDESHIEYEEIDRSLEKYRGDINALLVDCCSFSVNSKNSQEETSTITGSTFASAFTDKSSNSRAQS